MLSIVVQDERKQKRKLNGDEQQVAKIIISAGSYLQESPMSHLLYIIPVTHRPLSKVDFFGQFEQCINIAVGIFEAVPVE